MMMIPIHHIAAPFPSTRRMLAIRSWLKATRMKGIEMAAEMVTIEPLLKLLELYYFLMRDKSVVDLRIYFST
jgi:hypothetical protein